MPALPYRHDIHLRLATVSGYRIGQAMKDIHDAGVGYGFLPDEMQVEQDRAAKLVEDGAAWVDSIAVQGGASQRQRLDLHQAFSDGLMAFIDGKTPEQVGIE